MYKVFLNALVATSWKAFEAGNKVVKSRDIIKLHQEKYNVNSVIPHNVVASDNRNTKLFSFNKTLLFIKKLAFDGFNPLLVAL